MPPPTSSSSTSNRHPHRPAAAAAAVSTSCKQIAPIPTNHLTFDPWNSAATGHQRADGGPAYAGTTWWRGVREEKLRRQFAGLPCDENTGDGKKMMMDWSVWERRWVSKEEARRRGHGCADIRSFMGGVAKNENKRRRVEVDGGNEKGKDGIEKEKEKEKENLVPGPVPGLGHAGTENMKDKDKDKTIADADSRPIPPIIIPSSTDDDSDNTRRPSSIGTVADSATATAAATEPKTGPGSGSGSDPISSSSSTNPAPEKDSKEDERNSKEKQRRGIFAGLTIYINGSTYPLVSDHRLKQLLVSHGAEIAITLARRRVTHVILGKPNSPNGNGGREGCGGGLSAVKLQQEIQKLGGGCGVRFVGVEWYVCFFSFPLLTFFLLFFFFHPSLLYIYT